MIGLLQLLILATTVLSAFAADKPKNILVIVLDDLGYNELGYMNTSRHMITPNINRLASESIRFRNFHTGPICSPARSALLTGRNMIRIGTHANVIFWNTPWAPALSNAYMPEMMADVYRHRAHFGKWHLGMFQNVSTPMGRGFTESSGFWQGCGGYYDHLASECDTPVPPLDGDDDDDTPPPLDVATQDWWDGLGGVPHQDVGVVDPTNYLGYDWNVNGTINNSTNGTYSAWTIRELALDFLDRRIADKDPFMLHVWAQNTHAPLQVSRAIRKMYPELDNDPELQSICSMITAIDIVVGDIINKVDSDPNLRDNTVIYLQSDNGAPSTADPNSGGDYSAIRNFPLRGWKTQLWEGGTRVPALMRLPGVLQPRDEWGLMHVTDIFPTLYHAATGKSLPLVPGAKGMDPTGMNWTAAHGSGLANMYGLPIDGIDQWEWLSKNMTMPRQEMLYNINPLPTAGQAGPPKAAIRHGEWKLLVDTWDNSTGKPGNGVVFLYNILQDMSERHDLSKQNPQIVQQLLQRLRDYSASMIIPQQWYQPYQGPDYFCAKCPNGTQTEPYDAWRPWISQPTPPPPPPIQNP